MHKKVLVCAYHFPPDAAVGALRPQKFVKYLPEFGWKPYVLTIREQFVERRDDSRLADVGDTEVIRTDYYRTPLQSFFDLRDRFLAPRLSDAMPESITSHPDRPCRMAFSARLKRFVAEANWFPDDKMYWTLPAVWAGWRIMRRERITTLYATAPPHTVCLVGLILSMLTGSRLVIDFRDPWRLFRQYLRDADRSRLYDYLEELCERLVLRRAETVISATERATAALRSSYPAIDPEKFVTISNGYDASDFISHSGPPRRNERFVISYLGTFYLDRSPDTFLVALGRLLASGVIPVDGIEVRFIGNVATAAGVTMTQLLERHGVAKCVRVVGPVPYADALRCMQESDLLLLFAPNQPLQVPGKAFEYFGARRPVLAFTEEGATADLVRSLNAGLVVRQDDCDGIGDALSSLYHLWLSGDRSWYSSGDVTTLERRHLTRHLADLLDRPLTSRQSGGTSCPES